MMKLKILSITIIIILVGFILHFYSYLVYQKEIKKQVSNCYENFDTDYTIQDNCFCKMYNLLLPRLIIYRAYNNSKPLKLLIESGNPYIVPEIALKNADAIMGYGVKDEIDFEESFSSMFDKNAYTFDCGVQNIKIKSPKCHFKSECIGTDDFVLEQQNSSGRTHTFGEKLKQLKLSDKKVYLKMDIAGGENSVMSDILKYKDNITGMSLVIRFDNSKDIIDDIKMLDLIEKDFILIARNHHPAETFINSNCRYCDDTISNAVTLSFINKNLVDFKYIPFNQNVNKIGQLQNNIFYDIRLIPDFYTHKYIIFNEYLKIIFHKTDKIGI